MTLATLKPRLLIIGTLLSLPASTWAQFTGFVRPLDWPQYNGTVSTGYSTAYRGNYSDGPEGSGSHPGVDITHDKAGAHLTSNSEVRAIYDGIITRKVVDFGKDNNYGNGWGNCLVIKHTGVPDAGPSNSVFSTYAHLTGFTINPSTGSQWNVADPVPKGAVLGFVGMTGRATGIHLHFQIDKDYLEQLYPLHPFWPNRTDSTADASAEVDVPDSEGLVLTHTLSPVPFVEGHLQPQVGRDTWTHRFSTTSPPARSEHAMAYYGRQSQVVLFGGSGDLGTLLGDTWTWDGVNWSQQFPGTSPPPRTQHAMVYVAASPEVLLFGGWGFGFLNDTWGWDGSSWHYRSHFGVPPSARGWHAMAYDAARQQVLLFGGYDGHDPLNARTLADTWVWNGNSWRQVFPANSPPARQNHALVYDPVHRVVVLFGGVNVVTTSGVQSSQLLNDTWLWDGSNWTQRFPTKRPSARMTHGMTYDRILGSVVLFGGVSGGISGGTLNDTWLWDATNWTEQQPVANPPARWYPFITDDAARGQVLLFGGMTNSGSHLNDTWVYGASPFLSFVEGNPGVPGDGTLVSATSGNNPFAFEVSAPIPFGEFTDGLTVTGFLPPGADTFSGVMLIYANPRASEACKVEPGIQANGPSGTTIYNSTRGVFQTFSWSTLQNAVNFANSIKPGCGISADDLAIVAVEFILPGSAYPGYLTTIDAVTILPGPNAFPVK